MSLYYIGFGIGLFGGLCGGFCIGFFAARLLYLPRE